MKGILLAGGEGSRLYPLTRIMGKHLLPVYDKPMFNYSLCLLMLAGIREILIISTPRDLPRFKFLLRDGSHLGLSITYALQPERGGIAEAFIIGESFIDYRPVCLVLADTILAGFKLAEVFNKISVFSRGGMVFGCHVNDPGNYGVIEIDKRNMIISIEEKPTKPRSNYALPGLFVFDGKVFDYASSLKPSSRGELEITDLCKMYLGIGELSIDLLGRGYSWLETGTPDQIIESAKVIKTMEQQNNLKHFCVEETAYRLGLIDLGQLNKIARAMKPSSYSTYLLEIVEEDSSAIKKKTL